MPKPAEEVLSLFNSRRLARGLLGQKMLEIKDQYNGDNLVVALPEIDGLEDPAVANMTQSGIDQLGARIASVMPDLLYPALRPGQKRSEDYAKIRRRANFGWWEANDYDVKMGRRARYLIAYGLTSVIIRPDFKRGIPVYELRDPLTTYPASKTDLDTVEIENVIYTFARPRWWLERYYPEAYSRLAPGASKDADDRFECLEYADENETSIYVMGKSNEGPRGYSAAYESGTRVNANQGSRIELLRSVQNRIGMCPAVAAGRMTLDRAKGQFDATPAMYKARARLTALEIIAVERGIFPPMYLVSNPNETPKVIAEAEPSRGLVGQVQGGQIQVIPLNPGFQTNPTIDRLERAERLEGGVPAELGGESGSNIRTDRRGQSVLGSAIDFPIAEAQKIFERSLKHENIRAIAIAKAYFGNTPKSFWVNTKGARGMADYTPNVHFETDSHAVTFSLAGADANGITIRAGQAIGVGYMSKRRGAELDPLIDDPEKEHDRVIYEALEAALLSGIQSQVADPNALAVTDAAKIMELVVQDKVDLAKAVAKVQEEAQARQATVTAEGQPDTALPGAPATQPGITTEGQGAQVPATPTEGPPDVGGLSQLLFSLRSAQRQTPAEQAPINA